MVRGRSCGRGPACSSEVSKCPTRRSDDDIAQVPHWRACALIAYIIPLVCVTIAELGSSLSVTLVRRMLKFLTFLVQVDVHV